MSKARGKARKMPALPFAGATTSIRLRRARSTQRPRAALDRFALWIQASTNVVSH